MLRNTDIKVTRLYWKQILFRADGALFYVIFKSRPRYLGTKYLKFLIIELENK
jgi:hypothetical protein